MFREREPLAGGTEGENNSPAAESKQRKLGGPGKLRRTLISGALIGASLFGISGTAEAGEKAGGGSGEATKIELQEQQKDRLFGFGNLLRETRKYFLDRVDIDKQEEAKERFYQLQIKYGMPAVDFAQTMVGEEIRINADPKSEEAKELKLKHEFIDKILNSRELSETLLEDVDLRTMEPKEGRGNVRMRLTVGGKEVEVLVVFGYGRLADDQREDAAGQLLRHKAAKASVNLELAQLVGKGGYSDWNAPPGSDGRGNDFSFSTSFRNEHVGDGNGSYFIYAVGNYVGR